MCQVANYFRRPAAYILLSSRLHRQHRSSTRPIPTTTRTAEQDGHRMGFRGIWSRIIFYNLDKLKKGDEVVLKDSGGTHIPTGLARSSWPTQTTRGLSGKFAGATC